MLIEQDDEHPQEPRPLVVGNGTELHVLVAAFHNAITMQHDTNTQNTEAMRQNTEAMKDWAKIAENCQHNQNMFLFWVWAYSVFLSLFVVLLFIMHILRGVMVRVLIRALSLSFPYQEIRHHNGASPHWTHRLAQPKLSCPSPSNCSCVPLYLVSSLFPIFRFYSKARNSIFIRSLRLVTRGLFFSAQMRIRIENTKHFGHNVT